jgi:hypothetical protein
VYTGKIGSLQREKDSVKEVKNGYDCGITIDSFQDIKEGDIIETFENVEVLSDRKDGRGVIFDIFCTTDSGDKIIVEMQNYSQLFFKTRANYYLHNLMTKVLGRGVNWNNRFRIHTMRKVHIKSDDDIVTKQITGLNL